MKKMKKVIVDREGLRILPGDFVKVEGLWEETRMVLEALGHPEAFVTDLSAVSDFACSFGSNSLLAMARAALAKRASRRLGVEVKGDDLIVDIARRVREKRPS